MKRILVSVVLGLMSISAFAGGGYGTASPIPFYSNQVIVVKTASWDAVQGTLTTYERDNSASPWRLVGTPSAVVVGRNGMGWGRGLHTEFPLDHFFHYLRLEYYGKMYQPEKQEGDGKAPAGIFSLGSIFSSAENSFPNFSHFQTAADIRCVDDVNSPFYNQIINTSKVERTWTSDESMVREDALYSLGVTVNHNLERMPGAGSCIFMHVWRGPETGTAGCTAMDAFDMESVAAWLNSADYPVLVQLPENIYNDFREFWELP